MIHFSSVSEFMLCIIGRETAFQFFGPGSSFKALNLLFFVIRVGNERVQAKHKMRLLYEICVLEAWRKETYFSGVRQDYYKKSAVDFIFGKCIRLANKVQGSKKFMDQKKKIKIKPVQSYISVVTRPKIPEVNNPNIMVTRIKLHSKQCDNFP